MDWMEQDRQKIVLSDVDSATQYGTIGGQDTKQTSALSPTAFTSYLQNAPIPRCLLAVSAGTPPVGLNTLGLNSTTAGTYDPYSMLANTTDIRIPVDGFYTFFATFSFNIAVQSNLTYIQFVTVTSLDYGAGALLANQSQIVSTAAGGAGTNMSFTRPLNAGDSFHFEMSYAAAGATAISTAICRVGGAWVAPYKQFTTGAGGN